MCVPDTKCTGCSACMNLCPVNAITMKENDEGFIMPFVNENKCFNCGKCLKACPAIHINHKNTASPTLYAAMADNKVRAESSSGGIFTLIAEYILAKKGYVCGAAFDTKNNFTLCHRIISNSKELGELKGSKYVQSDINYIYREIKQYLSNGKPVLFTGTPCQVAGLYAFLGKDDKNLYTADILCHGVPSQKTFRKYIGELAAKYQTGKEPPKPVYAYFRDKRYGWNCEHIRIKFDNKKIYENNLKKGDPYEYLFAHNLALRKSCGNCSFAEFPRQGDISIGDFWGISKIDKTMTDQKGTSLVYVNSPKGEKLFAEITHRLQKVKEPAVPFNKVGNRVKANAPVNHQRQRFLDLIKTKSLEKSICMVQSDQFDIGLVSNFYAGNFGGALTQYALYHVLCDMGYSTLMIERPKTAKSAEYVKNAFNNIFIRNPYPDYAVAPMYDSKEDMRILNDKCNTFVVGSDQLFQYSLYQSLGEFVTLDWVSDTKKKIAYAASFGHDKIWGNPKVHAEMAYFMQKFDAFSVREESGVRIAKEDYGINAKWVLDPVFLCDPKHYRTLAAADHRKIPDRYIGGYVLDPTKEKQRIFKYAMKKMNLPVEIFSEYNCSPEYTAALGDLNVPLLRTEERLNNIINCDFFITDSFHGTCFSIIMKKPFISIMNQNRGASRFKSLLKMLHLENRLIESEKDLDRPDLLSPIDYDEVYKILDKEKNRCRKWLSDAIKKPKINTFSDYDMMSANYRQLNNKLNVLQQNIEILQQMIMSITGEYGNFLSNINDIEQYFNTLAEHKAGNIIIISVKDTPGISLTFNTAQKITHSLGTTVSLDGKHSHSYIAVIDSGKLVFEQLGEGLTPTVYDSEVSGHSLFAASRVYKNGNESVIKIDGKNYSVNERGLNIVVYDKSENTVIDSVSFDTHLPTAPCKRSFM